jgi:polyferredoxin
MDVLARVKVKNIITALAERPRLTRRIFQIGFLKLNLLIGVIFYHWVRYFESAGATRFTVRPAGVEGWLPVASLMGLRYVIETWTIPDIHPAGIFLMLAFLMISFLFRKAFCSWLCPIGTLSELLGKLGRRLFRTYLLPRWLDVSLRGLKYLLMGLFLYVICSMSMSALEAFLAGSYGLIADVQMLNFFRFMRLSSAITIGTLIVLSMLISNFWCRYLCPYGAFMGLFALASPVRIERSPQLCTGCARCSEACPSNLPVNSLVQIRSAECSMCMECIVACPSSGSLRATVGDPLLDGIKGRRVSALVIAAGILIVFTGTVALAKSTGHWETKLPDNVYRELIQEAQKDSYPGR